MCSMRLQPASLVVFVVLASSSGFSAPQQPVSPKTAKTGQKGASGTTLSGCVDQKDGKYVLVDEKNLNPVANLEADGFPVEGFAKHLGHKVTVRGTSSSGGNGPIFKVRSIETVSEICEPSPDSTKK